MRMLRVPLLLLALLASCASSASEPDPTSVPTRHPQPRPESAGEVLMKLPPRPSLEEVMYSISSTLPVGGAFLAIRREEALREQAGLPPNPILNIFASRIDLADVGAGPNKYRVFLRERLETAGKREARVLTATGRLHEVTAEARVVRFSTARAAAGAHQRAAASQDLLALRRSAHRAAVELLAIQETLVEAGRQTASVLPLYRERVAALSTAVLEEEALLKSALRNLEGIISIAPGRFDGVRGDLLTSVALPVVADGPLIDRNPAVLFALAAKETAEAELHAAKAKATPDVTVGLEYEHNLEFDQRFNMIGFNVESALPILDTNTAGIRAAHAEVRRSRVRLAEVRASAAAGYAEAKDVAETLSRGAESRRSGVIPAREQEAEFARQAHEAGRTDRRPLLAAKLELLAAKVELTELEVRVATWNLDALALLGRAPEEWGGSR